MSQHQPDDAGAAADSSSDDDFSNFLLSRLALQKRDLDIDKIFRAVVKLEGSDLHMRVGSPPMVRTKGELRGLNRGPVDPEEMVRLLTPMLDERAEKIFRKQGGVDFAYSCNVDGTTWRFRVNVLTQLGNIGLVARRINNFIPSFEGLFLPPAV
jgi:twitching motility protein PilT